MTDLEQTLNILRDTGVEFVVIGGLAGSAHGSASVTYDLDICYDRSPDNIQKLVDVLKSYHPRLRDVPDKVPFDFDTSTLTRGLNFTLTTDLGDVDLFGEVAGVGAYAEVKALSDTLELFGRPCLVLSLEGLIRSKRASARPKDLLVLPELEALREITPQLGDQTCNVPGNREEEQAKKNSSPKH